MLPMNLQRCYIFAMRTMLALFVAVCGLGIAVGGRRPTCNGADAFPSAGCVPVYSFRAAPTEAILWGARSSGTA
jgi:hypothetical protein